MREVILIQRFSNVIYRKLRNESDIGHSSWLVILELAWQQVSDRHSNGFFLLLLLYRYLYIFARVVVWSLFFFLWPPAGCWRMTAKHRETNVSRKTQQNRIPLHLRFLFLAIFFPPSISSFYFALDFRLCVLCLLTRPLPPAGRVCIRPETQQLVRKPKTIERSLFLDRAAYTHTHRHERSWLNQGEMIFISWPKSSKAYYKDWRGRWVEGAGSSWLKSGAGCWTIYLSYRYNDR